MIKKAIPALCALVAASFAAIAPVQADERTIHEYLRKVSTLSSQQSVLSAKTPTYLFTAHIENDNLVISTYEIKTSRKPGEASVLMLLEAYTDVKPHGPGNGDFVIVHRKSSSPHEDYGGVPIGKRVDVGIGGIDFVPGVVYCHRSAALKALQKELLRLKK